MGLGRSNHWLKNTLQGCHICSVQAEHKQVAGISTTVASNPPQTSFLFELQNHILLSVFKIDLKDLSFPSCKFTWANLPSSPFFDFSPFCPNSLHPCNLSSDALCILSLPAPQLFPSFHSGLFNQHRSITQGKIQHFPNGFSCNQQDDLLISINLQKLKLSVRGLYCIFRCLIAVKGNVHERKDPDSNRSTTLCVCTLSIQPQALNAMQITQSTV